MYLCINKTANIGRTNMNMNNEMYIYKKNNNKNNDINNTRESRRGANQYNLVIRRRSGAVIETIRVLTGLFCKREM